MKINKNLLKNLILEELEKVILLNEARFVVKQRKASTPKTPEERQEEKFKLAASDNNMNYPLVLNGKKYIFQVKMGILDLYDADENYLSFWSTSGRTKKPIPVSSYTQEQIENMPDLKAALKTANKIK
jgi:hypothetical protein